MKNAKEVRISMNATDTMRTRQKAQILEISDAPVSHSGLGCVYLACGKFLEQRGIGSRSTTSYPVRPGKEGMELKQTPAFS